VIATDRIVLRNNSIGHAARPTSSCRIPGCRCLFGCSFPVALLRSPRICFCENNLPCSRNGRQSRVGQRPHFVSPWSRSQNFRLVQCAGDRQPETFLEWHRTAFKTFWRWKSRKRGRPALPKNLRELVRRMACDNPTWGEERIAHELSLKLGIRVSPRTVGKYLERGEPRGRSGQRWTNFVRNHAQAIVASDFFVPVSASFRVLYVFVAMEVGSRRILHTNVTAHPPPSGPFSSSASLWRSITRIVS
jgi:hypothetical protein